MRGEEERTQDVCHWWQKAGSAARDGEVVLLNEAMVGMG